MSAALRRRVEAICPGVLGRVAQQGGNLRLLAVLPGGGGFRVAYEEGGSSRSYIGVLDATGIKLAHCVCGERAGMLLVVAASKPANKGRAVL